MAPASGPSPSRVLVPLYRVFLRRIRDLERSQVGSLRVRDGLRASWPDSFDAWWDADAAAAARRLTARRLPWLSEGEAKGEWTIEELRRVVRAAFRGERGEREGRAALGGGGRGLGGRAALDGESVVGGPSGAARGGRGSASSDAPLSARPGDAERISSGAAASSCGAGGTAPLAGPPGSATALVPVSSVPEVTHSPFPRFPRSFVPTASATGYHLPSGAAARGPANGERDVGGSSSALGGSPSAPEGANAAGGTVVADGFDAVGGTAAAEGSNAAGGAVARDGTAAGGISTDGALSPLSSALLPASSPLLSSARGSLGWISVEPAVQERGSGAGFLEALGLAPQAPPAPSASETLSPSPPSVSEALSASPFSAPSAPPAASAAPRSVLPSPLDASIAALRELETQALLTRASRVTRSSTARGLEIDATAFGPVPRGGGLPARAGPVVLRTTRVEEEISGSVLRGMRDLGRMLRLGGERKARGLRPDPTWADRLGTRSLVALAEVVLLANRDEELAKGDAEEDDAAQERGPGSQAAEGHDDDVREVCPAEASRADPSALGAGPKDGPGSPRAEPRDGHVRPGHLDSGEPTDANSDADGVGSVPSSSSSALDADRPALSPAGVPLPPGFTWERLLSLVPSVRLVDVAVAGLGAEAAGGGDAARSGEVAGLGTSASQAAEARASESEPAAPSLTFASGRSSDAPLLAAAETASAGAEAGDGASASLPGDEPADAHGPPEVQDLLFSALSWDGSSDVFGESIGGFVSPEVDAMLLRLGGYETDDEWEGEAGEWAADGGRAAVDGERRGELPAGASARENAVVLPASSPAPLPCFPLPSRAPPLARPAWAVHLDLPRATRRKALRRACARRNEQAVAVEELWRRAEPEDGPVRSSLFSRHPLPSHLSEAAARALTLTRRLPPSPSDRARRRSWSRGTARRFFVVQDPKRGGAGAGRGVEDGEDQDAAPKRSEAFAGHHRRVRRWRMHAGTRHGGEDAEREWGVDPLSEDDELLGERLAGPSGCDVPSASPKASASSPPSLVTLYDADEIDRLLADAARDEDEARRDATPGADGEAGTRPSPVAYPALAPSPALPSISLRAAGGRDADADADAGAAPGDLPSDGAAAAGDQDADSDLDGAFVPAAGLVDEEEDDDDPDSAAEKHIVRLRFVNTSSSALLVDRWHWSVQTAAFASVLGVEDSCPHGSGFALLPGEAFTLHVKPEVEGESAWFSGGVRVRRAVEGARGDADALGADFEEGQEGDGRRWEWRGEYVPFGPVELGMGLP